MRSLCKYGGDIFQQEDMAGDFCGPVFASRRRCWQRPCSSSVAGPAPAGVTRCELVSLPFPSFPFSSLPPSIPSPDSPGASCFPFSSLSSHPASIVTRCKLVSLPFPSPPAIPPRVSCAGGHLGEARARQTRHMALPDLSLRYVNLQALRPLREPVTLSGAVFLPAPSFSSLLPAPL